LIGGRGSWRRAYTEEMVKPTREVMMVGYEGIVKLGRKK
jgi:hypothetical protein